jgi:hypothetical protein
MSAILDKIFSHPGFDQLDRDALVARYDHSGAIFEAKSGIRSQRGQHPQVGNVINSPIPPEGIIISSPGAYSFTGDVTWAAASSAGAAITIAADGVELDMGGHQLQALVQDNSQFTVGIMVAGTADRSVSKARIRNGTLVNMCFYGICAEHVEDLVIENITVSGLVFDNLRRRILCPAGIHVDHAQRVTITGCTVQFLYATSDSSAGIQLVNTSDGTVSGCRMSDLTNYDGSVQGFSYLLSSGIVTSHCSADGLQSHFKTNIQTPGHTVLGFIPVFCVNMTYVDCTASNLIGCCDDCHGMSAFLVALVSVTHFTASTIIDGVTPSHSGAKATGLEVYGALVSVDNCWVENIRAINPQDKQAAGFSAWGVGITFTNCTAQSVAVTDKDGNWHPGLGYGTGFGWAPDPRPAFRDVPALGVTYDHCRARDCQVGFDTWNHVGSTWTNVSHTNCDIDFLVEPGATRTLTANPCSECNPPCTSVITNLARDNRYPGSSR